MNERIEKLEKSDTIKNLETDIKTYTKKYIKQTTEYTSQTTDDAVKKMKEYIKETIDKAVKEIKNPKSADDRTTSSNKESKPGDDDKT